MPTKTTGKECSKGHVQGDPSRIEALPRTGRANEHGYRCVVCGEVCGSRPRLKERKWLRDQQRAYRDGVDDGPNPWLVHTREQLAAYAVTREEWDIDRIEVWAAQERERVLAFIDGDAEREIAEKVDADEREYLERRRREEQLMALIEESDAHSPRPARFDLDDLLDL